MRPILRVHSSILLTAFAGCAATPAYLDSTSYPAQYPDSKGFVFESDQRYYVVQFLDTGVADDLDSDTIFGFLAIPVHAGEGLEWDDPAFGVGWQSVALVLSDTFVVKSGDDWRNGKPKTDDLPLPPDTDELTRLSVQRAKIVPVELTRGIELGRQLEIRGMDASLGDIKFGPLPTETDRK